MASIDYGTLCLGALVGIGCRKQLRSAGRVAAQTAASLMGVAAETAAQIADEASKSQASAEQEKATEFLQRIDQKIAQSNGQAGQNSNGNNKQG